MAITTGKMGGVPFEAMRAAQDSNATAMITLPGQVNTSQAQMGIGCPGVLYTGQGGGGGAAAGGRRGAAVRRGGSFGGRQSSVHRMGVPWCPSIRPQGGDHSSALPGPESSTASTAGPLAMAAAAAAAGGLPGPAAFR